MKEIFIGNTLRTPTMLACITRSVGDISRNARFNADSRQDGVAWLSHICSCQRPMAASRCRSTLTAVVRVSMS
jgi:hypothetical protein